MKRLISLLLAAMPMMGVMAQETEVTTAQAASMYKNVSKRRVSVHDPSVVYEPSSKRYYIFGSHKAGAYTTDMQNWTTANPVWTPSANNQAFTTPQVTKVKKGGVEVDLPAFNAMNWSARSESGYNINGNMWAPDVIWNEKMQKWCMYMSINGDAWHSSIVLLTADKITGPYQYQAPVVICGFYDAAHSYKDTDLELVLGTQAALPSRYNVGNGWGRRWPHTIDPGVFYDEKGNLWMVYGSWSGGIWMLELDEATGLRDYDVTYPSTGGSTDGVTSDPYFGKKVAGGFYVSGEGPYIEYVNGYYYLFISYGFLDSVGGYVMRVFRSQNPNGPYVDASGRSAIFSSYAMNYGKGADTRGVKIMGGYADWGFMTTGELAQGHNSVIAADDGRTYLVYHTRFNDGTEGHQVRVHQLFQTKTGWLVAAPFEYNGEQTTDKDIASGTQVSRDDIVGTYSVLQHKYDIDYANREVVRPAKITLAEDGTISGAYSGNWMLEEGTGYLQLKLGTTAFSGVVFEQQMDNRSVKAIAFSALSTSGLNVWGYKFRDDYSIAWHVNNQKAPLASGQDIAKNVDLYAMQADVDNVSLNWTSSVPGVISEYGKYFPLGLQEDTPVTLTARLTSGRYFWQQDYAVNALSEAHAQTTSTTWQNGMLAHYKFDDDKLANSLNTADVAQLLQKGRTSAPSLDQDEPLRNGSVVHLAAGANGSESYVSMPNPLQGKALTEGATISFFAKLTNANLWDALVGFVSDGARVYLTDNLYVGYNDGKTAGDGVYNNWIDINNPNSVTTGKLAPGQWHMVTVTFDRNVTASTGGVTIYVDGMKNTDRYAGSLSGKSVTARQNFDYNLIVDLLSASPSLFLGSGSFWGSPDVRLDDVIVYDRALSLTEVLALNQMVNRADQSASTDGIVQVPLQPEGEASGQVYDLFGRKVSAVRPGVFVKNGKKFVAPRR